MQYLLRITFSFLIVFNVLLAEEQITSVYDALDRDFQNQHISEAEYVAFQLMAIYDSEDLPLRYHDLKNEVTRRGTLLKARAAHLMETNAPGSNVLAGFFERPFDHLSESQKSPKGLFRIHYTTKGSDAADVDFIQQVAQTFDEVYEYETHELGYDPPPSDYQVDGPEYDVYVHNIYDYGMTTYDRSVSETDRPYDYTGYIEIDNDFEQTNTKGIPGMKVTAAHELFHLIQIGYRSYQTTNLSAIWLFESSATWMEDMAFDEINDYYYYLDSYFDHLDQAFHTANGIHEYGQSIFHHMLTSKYGANIVKRIWEQFIHHEALDAIDNALALKGSNLASELGAFSVWNFFTGDRAIASRFYEEGEHYPMLTATEETNLLKSAQIHGKTSLSSAKYHKISPQFTGEISVYPMFSFPDHWLYALLLVNPNRDSQHYILSGGNNYFFPYTNTESEMWIAPVNIKYPETNQTSITEDYVFNIKVGTPVDISPEILSVYPNPFKPKQHQQGMNVNIRLTKPADEFVVQILNENGNVVLHQNTGHRSVGDFAFHWDGRTEQGRVAAPGIYLFRVNHQEISPKKFVIVR